MELNFESVSFFILIQFVISFPVGYFILSEKIKSIPFIIKIPLYISLGFVIITIFLFILGLVVVNHYSLITIGIVGYLLLFYKLYKSKPTIHFNLSKIWLQHNYVSIISLVFFILIFSHFSSVAGFMGWPPAGDIQNHGLYTSLIDHNGKFLSSMSPLWPLETIKAPQGLHILAASYASLFDIFPGESFFVTGTAIIILIILTVFSTVYILTRSLSFSTLAMVTTFYIHPSGNLERWLVGYFFNGPYPNLYAYLILFLFIVFWLYLPKNERKDIKFKILILALVIGLMVVYPPFVILPGIFIVTELIINFLRTNGLKNQNSVPKQSHENKKYFSRFSIPFWSPILIPAIPLHFLFLNQILDIANAIRNLSFAYHISFDEYFIDHSIGVVFLAMILSVHLILKRKYLRLSIFYFSFSTIMVLSTQEIVSSQIWFFLSGRLFAFLYVFSWIILLLYTNEAIKLVFKRKTSPIVNYISNLNLSRLIKGSISILFISVLFYGPLVSHATFEEAEKWSWFPRSSFFQNDYYLLDWVSKNTDSTELLMTDYSFTNKFIQSFSIKNVTASIWHTLKPDVERAKEGQLAWANPQVLPNYLAKYNVTYIVLNSEWGFRDARMLGGDDTYKEKKFNVGDYNLIFSKFPFLNKVKEVGPSAVYKVVVPELNEFLSKSLEIFDFTTAKNWEKYENPEKFKIVTENDETFSIRYTNASNTSISIVNRFNEQDTVSLEDIRWINLSVNVTHPTKITLFLREPSNDYFLYIIEIDDELKIGKIENITIPIVSPYSIYKTPDLSKMERIQINLKSSSSNNLVTFHKIILSG